MKKILRFLCALTLVMSFAACTEKETYNEIEKETNNTQSSSSEYGVGKPYFIDNTTTAISVKAPISGNKTHEKPFLEASCGFIWCPERDGFPTMESNIIYCKQSLLEHYCGEFIGTISGLTEGQRYNVAAWLQMTPESDVVISDWITVSTANIGDTNWINLDNVTALSSNSLAVTITFYFDGNPWDVGIIYNTTGNPTYENFRYINYEAEHPNGSIQCVTDNPDGSRTMTVNLIDLQPNVTYYIRGLANFYTSGSIFTNETSATTLP